MASAATLCLVCLSLISACVATPQQAGFAADLGAKAPRRYLASAGGLKGYTWSISREDLTEAVPQSPLAGSSSDASQLVRCMNEKYSPVGMTWERGTTGQLPFLKAVAAWAPVSTTLSSNLTLVTSGSMDRLQQLRVQCSKWQGPLSAALFLGLVQDPVGPLTDANKQQLQAAVDQVFQFLQEVQQEPDMCQPSVLLTYQVYREEGALVLYPVNMLRNIARLQARTPLIAMLDVDLLPSASMFKRFSEPAAAQQVIDKVTSSKAVFLIPTFQMTGDLPADVDLADRLASRTTKDHLLNSLDAGRVTPFDFPLWKPGHALIDFPHWKTAVEDYSVKYKHMCEPWILASRTNLPWHDARYSGYGRNKVQHIHNLYSEQFEFQVLHDVYSVHRPHKHQAARLLFRRNIINSTRGSRTTLKNYVRALYNDQLRKAAVREKFEAATGPAHDYCTQQLSWWQQAV